MRRSTRSCSPKACGSTSRRRSSGRPSPARLRSFVDHVDVVVTIHGFGQRGLFGSLLLGGRNRTLAAHVGRTLRRALPAYDIVTDLERIPPNLRGLHADNPVNLTPGCGVQIELPPRVRGASPMWWDWEGPGLTPHTRALIDGLVDAALTWPAPDPTPSRSVTSPRRQQKPNPFAADTMPTCGRSVCRKSRSGSCGSHSD